MQYICGVAGSLFILSRQHVQFDSYFFQANEETLMIRNSTEQIAKTKEMIPLLCTVIAHKSINQLACTANQM